MTAATRQTLRLAIDRTVRARLPVPELACAGCGVAISDQPLYVTGCGTCTERRCGRAKRERQRAAQLVLFAVEGARL